VPSGSWSPIIFSASFPYRLVHTVIAAYLTTALTVGGVGAWHLLKDKADAYARKMFSMAMWMAALVAPVQILAGDQHGLNTLEHQPVKVLAMEGDFDPSPDGAPLVLFGFPSVRDATVHDRIAIPHLGSVILRHDAHAPLAGLTDYPREHWPPVPVVFWSFRIMVGLGLLMLSLGVWSLIARARKRLYDWRLLHRAALVLSPAGYIAVIAGWVTTEVGRQPYTVYGELLTADSLSPLAAPAIATSLAAFALVYFTVFGMGAGYIVRMMGRLPTPQELEPPHIPQHAAGITPASAVDHLVPPAGVP
jgi:cytochrome d ubiquinol oxidase subunit I